MDREKLYFLIKGSIYLLLIIYDRDLIFRGLSSFYTFEGIFIFVVADDRRELNLIFFFPWWYETKILFEFSMEQNFWISSKGFLFLLIR